MEAIKDCISAINQSIHCPICLDNINNPVVTPCNHYFCRFCIMEHFKSMTMIPCPVCKTKFPRRGLKSSTKVTKIASLINALCEAYEDDTNKPFECSTKPLNILNLSDELSQQHEELIEITQKVQLEAEPVKFIEKDKENSFPPKELKVTVSPVRKSRPAVMMGTSARKQRSKKSQEEKTGVKRGLSTCQTTSALFDIRSKKDDRNQTPSCANLFAMTQEPMIDLNEPIEILSQESERVSDDKSSNSLQRRSSTRRFFNRLLGSGQKDLKSDLNADKQKKPAKRNNIRTVPLKISKDVISDPLVINSEEPGPATQEAIDQFNQEIQSVEKFSLKIVDEADSDVGSSTSRTLRKRKASSPKDLSTSKRKSNSTRNDSDMLLHQDKATCHLSGMRETVYHVEINTPAKQVLNKRFTRSTVNDVLSSYGATLTPGDNIKSNAVSVNDNAPNKSSPNIKTPKRKRNSLNQSGQHSVSQAASKKLKKKYSLGAIFLGARTPKNDFKSPGWSHVQSMKKDMVSGKPPLLKMKYRKSTSLLTYTQISAKKKKNSANKDNVVKRKINSLLGKNSLKNIGKSLSSNELMSKTKKNSELISQDPNEATVILETEPYESCVKSKPAKNKTKPPLHRLIDISAKIRHSKINTNDCHLSDPQVSKYKSTSDLPTSQEIDNIDIRYDSASLSMIPDTEPHPDTYTQKSLSNKDSQKSASKILTTWSRKAIQRTCSFLIPKMLSRGSSKRSIASCVGSPVTNLSVNSSLHRLSDPEPCMEHLHCNACGETISLDAGNFTRCTGVDLSTLENESDYDPVAEESCFTVDCTKDPSNLSHDVANESSTMEMIPDTVPSNSEQIVASIQESSIRSQSDNNNVLDNKLDISQETESNSKLDNTVVNNEEEEICHMRRNILVDDTEDLIPDRSRSMSHSELMNTEDRARLENECAQLEANVASLERQLEEAALSPETVKRLLSTAVDTCSFLEDEDECEQTKTGVSKSTSSEEREQITLTSSNPQATSQCSDNAHQTVDMDIEPDMIPSSQENFDYDSATYPDQSQMSTRSGLSRPTSTLPTTSSSSNNSTSVSRTKATHPKITQFFSDNSSKDDSKLVRPQSRHPASLLVQSNVTSSQASQSTIVKPSNLLSTRRMSITGSGLNQEELVKLQKFCQAFNADFDARFVVLKTTHVIMKEEKETKRTVQRTLKYFLGILSKAWIVDFEWIKGSLFASTLLNETNYEIQGDAACGGAVNGPYLSRTNPGFLFSNLCLCPIGRLGLLSTQDFENLVEAGAGQYVPTPDTFPSVTTRRKLIVANRVDNDFSMDACKELFALFGVMIINVDWILDSISHARRLPLNKRYLIYAGSAGNSME